jgi:hypothetical protein
MKLLFLALVSAVAAEAIAEKQPYDRYQSIIDRQMFGTPPPGFDPEKMPSEVVKTSQKELTKEQAKLQSAVHFSVINIAADGTPIVGFSDNSNPKTPVHHYIKVGEESGGWKVLSADTAEKTMTIQKDGVELTLKLGDNSGASAGGGAAAVPALASASALRSPRRSGLLGTLGSRRALRERQLREREEAEKKEREAENARREQEKAEREQEKEEQRQQLRSLQESLSQLRAEKQKTEQSEGQNDAENNVE